MASNTIEYLTNREGQPDAVVIPMSVWQSIFPDSIVSAEDLVERMEDYCLGRAMDEAAKTPTLNKEEALAFLEGDLD